MIMIYPLVLSIDIYIVSVLLCSYGFETSMKVEELSYTVNIFIPDEFENNREFVPEVSDSVSHQLCQLGELLATSKFSV